ncbi:MAG: GRP family sugar transporter [Candidatus Enteromonas sp.]|nr:GRP family sugar transporter [Candidatus Enteromonas sp.]
MLWLILALIAALATSLTTVFAKIGIKDVPSDFATFFRTGIVLVCAAGLCFITGSWNQIPNLTPSNWIFLVLSGLCTGCSWLCYYRALQLSSVNRVAPIDKSSFLLTSILFLIFFFNDVTKGGDPLVIGMLFASMALMLGGTLLMAWPKKEEGRVSKKWIFYAVGSAVFASLVSLFVKIGLQGMSSDLGTFLRTVVVLIFSGAIALARKQTKGLKAVSPKSWVFLTLSGLATGVAWLGEYYALNMEGVNPVAVNAIGKLSILLTMLFSATVLKERFSWKSLLGLGLLTGGIILIVVFSL